MIKLSKKGSYAIKSILYIANNNENIVKIKDISKSENISETFLRIIISDLERSKIIKTIKWRKWWVLLNKKLEQINIYEILFSVWEDLSISKCSKWLNCENIEKCSINEFINKLQKSFNVLLKIYTIDKILQK